VGRHWLRVTCISRYRGGACSSGDARDRIWSTRCFLSANQRVLSCRRKRQA